MDVLSRLREWIGVGDGDGPRYVCINCAGDLGRNYRERPDCGKPSVVAREAVSTESTRRRSRRG